MSKSIYKINFINHGTVYEIYANKVTQSNLLGFLEIEEIIFGEKNSLVVDPSEERLKSEFTDVKRSFIPMHAVLRIDEVFKKGLTKIKDVSEKNSNISPFPTYTPTKERT